MAARGHLVQGSDRWHVLGTFLDVTDRKKAEARVEHLGFYDALTELPNQRLFNDRINVALAQARRSGKIVAVLNLDLDNFKVINDTLGRRRGPPPPEAADRLSTCVRGRTIAGGTERVQSSCLPSKPGELTRSHRGSRRLPRIVLRRWRICMSLSIGISVYPGR
jgi:diguanylate cyclase (GGDEF)-like protein